MQAVYKELLRLPCPTVCLINSKVLQDQALIFAMCHDFRVINSNALVKYESVLDSPISMAELAILRQLGMQNARRIALSTSFTAQQALKHNLVQKLENLDDMKTVELF